MSDGGPSTPRRASRLVVVDPRLDDYRCLTERTNSVQLTLTLTTHGAAALRLAPSFADAMWLICPQLPDMSGLDLLEMLASLNSGGHAVVIDNEYDRNREAAALRRRAVQYLCKPIHPAWLDSWRLPHELATPLNPPHAVPGNPARTHTPSAAASL